MIGTGLANDGIACWRQAPGLQKLLKRGLMVGQYKASSFRFDSSIQERSLHEFSSRGKTCIEVDRRHHSFKRVGEQRGLLSAPGFLLAFSKPQVMTQTQAARRFVQGSRIHQPCAAFGKLSLGPIPERANEVLADEETKHRVAGVVKGRDAMDMPGTWLAM